jgi:hypothetical protein
MIPAGRAGSRFILSSSKLSTEDDVKVFEGEYCPTLKSGLMSLEMEMVRVEDRSENERLDLRFSSLVVTTVTETLLFV